MTTDTLFPAPAEAPVPRVAPELAEPHPGLTWSRYTGDQVPCDDCKQAQHLGLLTWAARFAYWQRYFTAPGRGRQLCRGHAAHWRHADRLPPLLDLS